MHFLELSALSESHIFEIFKWAEQLKTKPCRELLKGKTFVLFFPETSIRTRVTLRRI
ncbi:hypothetical protein [Cohnella cellulosilytica]|uniref:Aspartate/ornithine carbamoyltransferase carbamoyl-P binding domain-containing protein n=1 Tax=Cohnella cellulosilytica TaxID=986710 RepID=A0ABW2FKP7_9BACL